MEYEEQEEDRKEIRKRHLQDKKNHQKFVDDEMRYFNKCNKHRKYKIQELEQVELEEEWEEYLN
jgi:hypothetical protein